MSVITIEEDGEKEGEQEGGGGGGENKSGCFRLTVEFSTLFVSGSHLT